jgi:transposase
LFRTRDLLVRQRTQLINALRGQLSEHGVVAPQGPASVVILVQAIDDMTASLPLARGRIGARIPRSDRRAFGESRGAREGDSVQARRDVTTRRLQTMPGIGPITAMAIETFAPPMEVFRRGRDLTAWLGLVPVQHSTGGKQVLGKTSKMGQCDIRRLLITGAMVIVRWACRKGAREGTWLHRMLGRKPRMLVAIALANKMARSIWAMLTKEEDYRGPVAATV